MGSERSEEEVESEKRRKKEKRKGNARKNMRKVEGNERERREVKWRKCGGRE